MEISELLEDLWDIMYVCILNVEIQFPPLMMEDEWHTQSLYQQNIQYKLSFNPSICLGPRQRNSISAPS